MLLRCLAVFSLLSGVLSEITSQEVEYDVDNKVFEPLQYECVDAGAVGTLTKIAINATMQMPTTSWGADFFIAVYDPVNETGRQVGGTSYLFKPFITDAVSWDAALNGPINGNLTSYVDITAFSVKLTYQVCYGNGYPHGGNIAVHGKFVLSDLVESSSPPSMEPTHSVMPTLPPQVVEYDVDNKVFEAENFECVDAGAAGTLTKIAIDVNMQMTSSSWGADFFIAVYDPVNETGRQVGGLSTYRFKPFITDVVSWDAALNGPINGNVTSYVDITAYTVKSVHQVCYGNGYPHGGNMTVDGKIILSDLVASYPSSPPTMAPTHSPTMQPTHSVMPTLPAQKVEYDVDDKAFEPLQFECVDAGAVGTLTKIAIDVNMQMPTTSWGADFLIAVYDPVNETGRQVGGISYLFKPFITEVVPWDAALNGPINGNLTSYVDITAYTVKSAHQVCYGNGYPHGGNMTLDGKIVLSDLVASYPSSPPTMAPTHSPTMQPTHSVMPTLPAQEVEYDVDDKAFEPLQYECVDVRAEGTLNKIAIDATMQMPITSWASDFLIAVYDPVNETGRQVGGVAPYQFKPFITDVVSWGAALNGPINGNVASYVDITAYTVKSTYQVCYGHSYDYGEIMTFDGKVVLSDLVDMHPSSPPTMAPTHSPTMQPTHSVMPTLSAQEVEYGVDNKVFGPIQYECVDAIAEGTLNKIAIDVNMQMTSSSWASDFFIAVYDPVNETGRQVGGGPSYYFKPFITDIMKWDSSLRKTINGNVESYVNITAYSVKSAHQVCYGNGYDYDANMTVDGKIVLSDLVDMHTSRPPTMAPTHSPTMQPTHSVMPTILVQEVEYVVDNNVFGPLQYECVDVGAQGTLTKIAIDVNMQMTSSSWASDFFIAVYDPVNETGRQVGGGPSYYFKPFITDIMKWDSSLRKTINGNVASYVNITAYIVKSTYQVCYGNGYDYDANMTVDGKIVLSDLVASRPSSPPTVSPTPVSCMAKPKQVGNGVCNKNGKNNVESCMWDGGDCCEQSCVNNPDPKYAARCGRNGYQCLDPDYASSPTAAPGQEECTAPKPHSVGNGVCNHNNGKNNVAACGWDGGDCCEESCLDNPNPKHVKRCGMRGYHCLDPAYANSPTAAPGPAQCLAKPKQLGNGICNKNGKNNKAECGWDGGDCCEVSCLSNSNPKKAAKCGNKSYQCLDPQYVV